MKCIHCGTDSDYRARQANGRCRACRREFAFEPKRDRGMTDLAFKLAIEAVSDDGRLSWTDDHLYYDVARRARRRRVLHRMLRRPIVSLDRDAFDRLFGRWIVAHGEPGGRLTRRAFAEEDAPAAGSFADYGFEHLLVCDTDAIADTLLVNGFHAELKCPVLSAGGYPAHVYEALLPRLRERPPETVVVIHDADWDGCRLARALVDDPRWFAGVELPRVVDAGLRPADAASYRGLYQQASSGFDPTGISEEERKWLSRYRLELAAARPRVLMGVLARVLRGDTEASTGAPGASDGALWSYPDAWAGGDDDAG